MNNGTSITAEGSEEYRLHTIRIEEASSLIIAGNIAFISQALILFLFNLNVVLDPTLRQLNPQAVRGAELFAAETSLGIFVALVLLHHWMRKRGSGFIHALLILIATLFSISINAIIVIPLSGAGLLGKVLAVILLPFDNYIMGIGLILMLAGSILFLVHSMKKRRIQLNRNTQ